MGVIVGGLPQHIFPAMLSYLARRYFSGDSLRRIPVERSAYRYASVAVAIITLVPRANKAWVVALHRFVEVSIGIAVGLAVTAIWPERRRNS